VHDISFHWFGTGTLIKSGGVMLVLFVQISTLRARAYVVWNNNIINI
jgi:hypothetical protein